jgi:hypothetical protein
MDGIGLSSGGTMPGATSISDIITAFAGILTAASLLLGALAVFLPAMRKLNKRVDSVHDLVNGQHTALVRYNAELIQLLQAHGIAVPPDPSVDLSEEAE